MSTYVRRTVHYVTARYGDAECRLVVEGNKVVEARLLNSHGSIHFVNMSEMKNAAMAIEEVLRRFANEAKDKGEDVQET